MARFSMLWNGSARRWLCVTVPLVLLSPVAGADAQGAVAVVVGIACIFAIRKGIKAWTPTRATPWLGLAASVGLFVAGSMVREIESMVSAAIRYPSIADVVDAAGYIAGIVSVVSFQRLRRQESGDDQTDLIDTLVVVAGVAVLVWAFVMVPSLRDSSMPGAGRAVNVVFSFLSLALFGTLLRLAVGPGARNVSWYMLAGATGAALAADVFDSAAFYLWGDLPSSSLLSTLLPSVAFVLCGAAALQPSMADLTLPAPAHVGSMSRARLVAMLVAVLIPPGVLLLTPHDQWRFYVPAAVLGWAAVSALGLVRLGGLVRARERIATRENTLARLSGDFAGATTVAELGAAAARGVEELLAEVRGPIATILLPRTTDDWYAGTVGLSNEDLRLALAGDRDKARALAAGLEHRGDPQDAFVLDVPANGPTRMRILVSAAAPMPTSAIRSVTLLAANLSLALEAQVAVARVHQEAGEHRFRALVEHSSDVVAILADGAHIAFMSPAAGNLLGWDDERVIGSNLTMGVHGDDRPTLTSLLRWAAAARRAGPVELRIRHADGGWRWFEAIATDLSPDPLIQGVVLNLRDVTERKAAEQRLGASEARFRSLVQHSSDVITVIDPTGLVEYISPSSTTVLGRPGDAYVGREFDALVHPDDRVTFASAVLQLDPANASVHRLELRLLTAHGAVIFDVTITDLRSDPAVNGIVLNARDVGAQKALEHDLRHLASHDDLTELANRVLFREQVSQALQWPRRPDQKIGVLFIDVDDFKTVNDSLGHGYGDQLLSVIAERLRSEVPAAALPARIGGDEFAVLVAPVADTETLVALANHLIAVIGQPVDLGGRWVVVNASVGITISGGDEPTGPEIMLRDADAAMYHAKAVGKGGVQVFDQSMHVSAIERLDVKADLAHALDRSELVLHYQPIMDLATSQVVGFESLVRWQHPTRGLVSPETFLPIAAETGLINDMGRWILRTALHQLASWQTGNPSLQMSVNLAPSQLAAAGIVGDVAGVLELTGVAPTSVVLELTEDRVLEDETWIRRLREIRGLGVGLEADDFGSGYASYAALQQLPFTGVKIDRSLISALGDTVEDGSGPQVRSIIEMAHAIGLGVVAEGIEGAGQAAVLRDLGCDLAQGFYFARPAPADAFDELLSHAHATPLAN